MLNSVVRPSGPARVRLSPEERRRQLVGIGLRKFVERPVQELSLDEVAAEAGVSRGLLFHYFPSKTAYHRAVVAAAGRRVLRNLAPDPDAAGEEALRQIVDRFVAQVRRRRESYLALVYGQAGPLGDDPGETATTLRSGIADLVCRALASPDPGHRAPDRRTVHAWVAYVEDRALHLPPEATAADLAADAAHCAAALRALLAVAPTGTAGARVEALRHCCRRGSTD